MAFCAPYAIDYQIDFLICRMGDIAVCLLENFVRQVMRL